MNDVLASEYKIAFIRILLDTEEHRNYSTFCRLKNITKEILEMLEWPNLGTTRQTRNNHLASVTIKNVFLCKKTLRNFFPFSM